MLINRGKELSTPPSILELRRIEAAILGDVFAVLKDRHGVEEAQIILDEAVSSSAIRQGKTMQEQLGREPDLEDFADIIPLWEADGALEIEILHRAPDRFDFNVQRCRYAEMYAEMGLGEIGHLLSCNRDAGFCVGYNPNMELKRTQTIMLGAGHCDFRYRMRDEPRDKT
jgi:L-2-amino-thiazoline-4-carboxylic acid hydrolase